MNNKLSGVVFILFGIGLLGDSMHAIYSNDFTMKWNSLKPILLTFLGISSCIYGYKLFNQAQAKKEG